MKNASKDAAAGATRIGSHLSAYSSVLCDWYTTAARPLPWRTDPTPYHVWVSEIMLQQTRIEAVLPHYENFLAAFPDVFVLAETSEEELLKQWEGLGYYSRARNLQKAARVIVAKYGGKLPADHAALLALPGIGEYTAGAIASIAFGIPAVAVDGNVLRVLARLTGEERNVLSPEGKAWFTAVAAAMLPEDRPGVFNSALMELGERICLPHTVPRCAECPLYDACRARMEKKTEKLPVRVRRAERRVEKRNVAVVLAGSKGQTRVLLHRRPAEGLLAGLWEFPNVEGTPDTEEWCALFARYGGRVEKTAPLPDGQHLFTHIRWELSGVRLTLSAPVEYPDGVWVTLKELQTSYALPSAFRCYARLLPLWMEETV